MRAIVAAVIGVSALAAYAGDWPCFRGPERNNNSTEKGWRTDWKAQPPKLLWQAQTGYRQGCPVIADGRVFVHGDDYTAPQRGVDSHQTLFAFDAATGRELWKDVSVVWSINTQPITYSPTVDGDRVYFYTSSGTLKCLKAASGEAVWVEDLTKTVRADRAPSYGYRCSPVVWKDVVIVTVRVSGPGPESQNKRPNLAAFDKMTGKLVWLSEQPSVQQAKYTDWGSHWHTPTLATIHGRDTLVYHTGFSCVGIDPKDGVAIWEYKVPADEAVLKNKPEPGVAATSPVVAGDIVVFPFWSGHVAGHTYGIRVKPDFSIERLWMTDELTGWKLSCLTEFGGAVFGVAQGGVHDFGPLKCIDLKTGQLKWTQGEAGRSAKNRVGCGLTVVDGKLVIWDGTRVHLANATAEGYREIAVSPDAPTATSVPSPNQNGVAVAAQMIPPIVSNGRLYCRNDAGDLFCYDISGTGGAGAASRP